ncbi:hypothetical protein ES319_A07G211800v1 [Gossypium barbadense]|uniref:RPA-interacting protein N-terminal domain-containing protein n=2 Tax=Gossypium TaxID=3633 RepID=A0A5J5V6D9_GOSBA|nr:hypothetical protein ES319_A07G211800v1 [Gossypium barbadense]TYH11079.1 hypothetical protein ES288_A07G229900v1 [Gossypium darwinii]
MEPKMEDTCPIIQRPSLKTHPRFNNYSLWKHKLRENCYKRVREDRTRLLWKMRLPAAQSFNHKEFINTAFQDIVSDELKKIKGSPISDCLESSNSVSSAPDELWEYSGLQDAYQGECEEILLEMQRIFYEDLRREPAGKEPKEGIESWEDEQDEYLARAVYEHMQLNDEQVQKQIWCPICKRGELQQNQLIYCTLCKLQLNRDDEVNLDVLRDRLAEAHVDHLERGCRLKPKFCLETKFGLTALYILCQDCCTFEIVI